MFPDVNDSSAVTAGQLRALLAQSADYYWLEDAHQHCELCYGKHGDEQDTLCKLLQGRHPAEIGLAPVEEAGHAKSHRRAISAQQPFADILFRLQQDDEAQARHLRVSGSPRFDQAGSFLGYHCVATDISHEHQSQTQLQRFRAAMDASMDMMYLVDRETLRFIDVNETAWRNSGLSREKLLQKGPGDILDMSSDELIERYDRLIQDGGSSRIERFLHLPPHAPRYVEVSSKAVQIDGRWMIIGMSRDITKRKRAELRNERLQHLYSALNHTNEAILKARTPATLYHRVCEAVVTSGRFIIASVLQPDADGWLQVSASAGPMREGIGEVHMSIREDRPEGQGISGQAWRNGQAVVSNDTMRDSRMLNWRHRLSNHNVSSAAAMPLMQQGKQIALLLFYADETHVFDEEMMHLLRRMRDNINYALDSHAIDESRRLAEQRTRESEARFRSLTQLSSDFYWEMDQKFRFLLYQGRIIGQSNQRAVAALIGKPLWEMQGIRPDAAGWSRLQKMLDKEETFRDFEFSFTNDEGSMYHFALSGEPIFDSHGKFDGYRGLSRDITEQQRIAEHIQHMATHDSLTGLPNRIMFTQMLNQAINSARRYPTDAFAVLFIDLDRFKLINDSHGHQTGDQLLVQVARRLREPLRESDIVARLGGDEFVILLPHLNEAAAVQTVAENLLQVLERPIEVDGHECNISASMGFSIYGDDADSAEALLRHADAAMYAAKSEGRNNAQPYAEDIHRRTQERVAMERNLRRALDRGEFELHYQAKVALDTQRIIGAEALLRWHSPSLGRVAPDRFIPVAEENGLIIPIGTWVMEQACRQFMRWQHAGIKLDSIAVNLSARQLNEGNFTSHVAQIIKDTGIQPAQLELEITESTMIQNPRRTIALMKSIRALGVRLAMDDFGTGYSSLSYLKAYPLDTLKIDRSFIANVAADSKDQAICAAIITLARTMGLSVVAEGVETEAQLAFLREQGCQLAQGFLLHYPADAESFGREVLALD